MLLSRKLGAGYMYVIKLIKKFVCSQFQTHRDELGYLSGLLNVPNCESECNILTLSYSVVKKAIHWA